MKKYLIISIFTISLLITGCASKLVDKEENQELLNKIDNSQAENASLGNNSSTTSSVIAPVPGEISSEITLGADTILYKNSKYGFSLEFPKAWEGFTVVEDPFVAWNDKNFSITDLNRSNYPNDGQWSSKIPSSLNVLSFHLKGDSERLFSIGIYTKEQWNEYNRLIKNSSEPEKNILGIHMIGQNDKNVFGLTYQDYSGPHIVNAQDSIDRGNEINSKVLPTFKIIK